MPIGGIQFNNDIREMSPEEGRERIVSKFRSLSADIKQKQKIRELLTTVWIGGLDDGDATVQKENIPQIVQTLRALPQIGVRQKETATLLISLLETLESHQ